MQLPDHTPFEVVEKISRLSKKDRKAIEKRLSGLEKLEFRRLLEAQSSGVEVEEVEETDPDPLEHIPVNEFSPWMQELVKGAFNEKSRICEAEMTEFAKLSFLKSLKAFSPDFEEEIDMGITYSVSKK